MPLLATPATRHELLRQIVRLGVFPERPRTDGTETVLGWVRPEVDKPNLVRHEVRFTSEQRLSSLAWNDAWRVKEIHYGPRNRLTFAPLAWPELPTEAPAEMGAGWRALMAEATGV